MKESICTKCSEDADRSRYGVPSLTEEYPEPIWCELCGNVIPVKLSKEARQRLAIRVSAYVEKNLDDRTNGSDPALLWRAYTWLRLDVTVDEEEAGK